jgi:hypothetical protein
MPAMLATKNSVARSKMNPQLRYTLTHRLAVAEITGLHLSQSCSDPGLGYAVAQRGYPLYERVSPIFFLVIDELDHE